MGQFMLLDPLQHLQPRNHRAIHALDRPGPELRCLARPVAGRARPPIRATGEPVRPAPKFSGMWATWLAMRALRIPGSAKSVSPASSMPVSRGWTPGCGAPIWPKVCKSAAGRYSNSPAGNSSTAAMVSCRTLFQESMTCSALTMSSLYPHGGACFGLPVFRRLFSRRCGPNTVALHQRAY